MFFPLYMMHTVRRRAVRRGGGGFGGKTYAAPQAGLMAALSQGIVGGEMAWPLVVVGIAMGISLILVKVRSPMLFSVGMYLPLEHHVRDLRRRHDPRASWTRCATSAATTTRRRRAWRTPASSPASGLIAGEALLGLFIAAVVGVRS